MARRIASSNPRPWIAVPPPVILVGMHRSGTSLAAATLVSLGAFLGPGVRAPEGGAAAATRRSGYGEAAEFFRLNELLLAVAGAAWDRVEPFLERRGRPGFDLACTALLGLACRTTLRRRFLAPLLASGAAAWGWKDPRTSLTLPYWLRLFPAARVLHVRRDPEAAAASLHRRAREWAEAPRDNGAPAAPAGFRPRRALRALAALGRGAPPAAPDPCLDLDHCRALALRYERECAAFRRLGDRYLEVRYEALLADPAAEVERLSAFTACDASPAHRARAAALVTPLR